ncbi:hypothetical protein [Anaplasma phagocytophilum]|nr:hypothetical protein [Anaplasma phagocytophilum]KJZ98390.1 hypothetical protein APHCR_0242 [Anaplasma phagocytophilum str. CR1007]AGR79454.1 hypothetical protein YYU_03470 [Anaplasma phagocytophilum str. HZ2]AGR80703.1 hypothetical protein WSQ_03470 [Anaplasma phagocytophilum str. JM]AGR81956.1 hypothetical protein YYY_03465 [Anaplasma phagocytophilum str. Dog2]EOA61036.1 hypothetical protein HGE1_03222 [Anaplasma phagocytophilum str. HGE1]
MHKPGGGGADMGMGPNIASVQSLMHATQERAEAAGGGEEGDDRSSLAIMNAVLATPVEAMKADLVGSLLGNIDKAAMSLGANLSAQFSIYGPSKTSLAFGFPILFDSIKGGGEGGDEAASGGGEGGEDYTDGGDDERYLDGRNDPHLYDPWDFDQYPHADESIGRAAQGLDGVSHEERGHEHHVSPSPSPNVIEHSEGRGM